MPTLPVPPAALVAFPPPSAAKVSVVARHTVAASTASPRPFLSTLTFSIHPGPHSPSIPASSTLIQLPGPQPSPYCGLRSSDHLSRAFFHRANPKVSVSLSLLVTGYLLGKDSRPSTVSNRSFSFPPVTFIHHRTGLFRELAWTIIQTASIPTDHCASYMFALAIGRPAAVAYASVVA
ncbi:hypothetical protein GGP41_010304 [Bipolaris sorokiniana]|uniref:Uncharacterized protein n=1 Tax=Cochliobolus sativus TaxID=45130 RepID=A0A8H6DWP4_COCSA|nr:hypothetical protein GGP41_010304 [Bipolaris sorokiniana]